MSRSKRNGVWIDEGPSSAAAADPVAMHSRLAIPGLSSSAAGGAGPIERRQVTQAEIEARRPAPIHVDGAVTDQSEPETDEEDEEDPPMDEPIADQPDTTTTLRELVAAANVADEAWDAWRVADLAMAQADERWELARRDLIRAWESARDLVALTCPSLVDVVELGEAIGDWLADAVRADEIERTGR